MYAHHHEYKYLLLQPTLACALLVRILATDGVVETEALHRLLREVEGCVDVCHYVCLRARMYVYVCVCLCVYMSDYMRI